MFAKFAMLAVVLSTLLASPQSSAEESRSQSFLDEVERANGHFRTAAGYLRTQNIDAAAIEIESLIAAWTKVSEKYGAAPPDALSQDPDFATSIKSVTDYANGALKEVDNNDPESARAILLNIRKTLNDLRRRNNLYVLADCIFEINQAMPALWRYRKSPPDLTVAEEGLQMVGAAAVYVDRVRRCKSIAPVQVRSSPEFSRLIDGAIESLSHIPRAAKTRDGALLLRVIRELKSIDTLLFFRFG